MKVSIRCLVSHAQCRKFSQYFLITCCYYTAACFILIGSLHFVQEKLFADTLVKTMVEPRRRCFTLPAVDLRKKAVGGIIYIRVISANKLSGSCFKTSRRQPNGATNGYSEDNFDDKDLETYVEVEVEELTRRTDVRMGSTPRWDAPFNMVLHDNTGTLRFNLYQSHHNNVRCDYLASCEIKVLPLVNVLLFELATGEYHLPISVIFVQTRIIFLVFISFQQVLLCLLY